MLQNISIILPTSICLSKRKIEEKTITTCKIYKCMFRFYYHLTVASTIFTTASISSNTIYFHSRTYILRDEEHSAIPLYYTLSPSQNRAFQYISILLTSMEPLTIEQNESNIHDIEEDIVSFLFSIFNWIHILQNFTLILMQISILILNHFLKLF